jgi:hypothetical protein
MTMTAAWLAGQGTLVVAHDVPPTTPQSVLVAGAFDDPVRTHSAPVNISIIITDAADGVPSTPLSEAPPSRANAVMFFH